MFGVKPPIQCQGGMLDGLPAWGLFGKFDDTGEAFIVKGHDQDMGFFIEIYVWSSTNLDTLICTVRQWMNDGAFSTDDV